MTATLDNRAAKEKRRKLVYSRKRSAEEAEIGEPPVTDEQRKIGDELREKCRRSLLDFNRDVFPESTGLKPFGDVQLSSIAHDESVILRGGKICKAEPRAYGKTSRTCNAAKFGVLYGYRDMVPVFSANLEKSRGQIIERWRTEFTKNDLLFWMFPELIWPLRALENKPQRCASQTFRGELTQVKWTADRIVLPWILDEDGEPIPGAGACLIALPLKSCRGATHTRPDGTILRPDLVIFDDVQKDEDAENPNTVKKIEDLIDHTAMMLGGHAKTMSAIMNCTVRHADDLSETYLRKSGWRRVRYKMLQQPATAEKEFWFGKYAEARTSYDPESPDDQERAKRESLALYEAERAKADEGAKVTWDWAYAWADEEPTEISAIQHAYNIRIDLGESVFQSECQNEPIRDTGGLEMLSLVEIMAKQSGYGRNEVPAECVKLSGFIDVHPDVLYWHVWAWEPRFTGFLVNYGTFPEQGAVYFRHSMLHKRLSRMFRGHDMEACVTAALKALVCGDEKHGQAGLLNLEWTRTDGVPLKIASLGIDANGEASDAVKKFIRQNQHGSVMYPSFGKGVTARTPPISTWQQYRGSGDGPEWVTTKSKTGDPPGVLFDTNWWKTKFHRGLAMPEGSQGSLMLFKVQEPQAHRLNAEHFLAEKPVEVTAGSRTVYEFGNPLEKDNHYFDCAVGSMVAASRVGITSIVRKVETKARSLAEIYGRR